MATAHAPRKGFIDGLNSHKRTSSIPPGILSQSKESLAKVLTGLALDLPKIKMASTTQLKTTNNFNAAPRRNSTTSKSIQPKNDAPRRNSNTMKPVQSNNNLTIQNSLLSTHPAIPTKQLHHDKKIDNALPLKAPGVKPTPSLLKPKEQLAHEDRSEVGKVPPKLNSQLENNSSTWTHSIPPSLNRNEPTKILQTGAHATTTIKVNQNNATIQTNNFKKPLIRTQTALSILPFSTGPIDQTKLPFNTQVNLPSKTKRNSIDALTTYNMPVQIKLPKIEPSLDAKPKKVSTESNDVTVNLFLSNSIQAHSDFSYRPAWQVVTISAASLIDLSGCQRKLAAKVIPDTANRQKRLRGRTRRPAKMTIKAVFFDLYGVYVRYLNNESALALIRKIITTPSLREKIFDYERGKYSCEECLDVVSIVHPPIKEADDLESVDFWSIVAGVDENIEKAVRKLKENGYKVGILCNNAYWTPKREKSMIPDDLSLFDVVIESCKVGYRKSDPEIYWLAAEALGLECHECVLVDDSMLNVHGAMDQGMFGIKQQGEDSKTAIEELENLLYIKLH